VDVQRSYTVRRFAPVLLREGGGAFVISPAPAYLTRENPAVDTAWVGVIGTGVGGAIAGLTALAGNALNLRQTRLQLGAQSDEAHRQRLFESVKDLREVRSEAYAKFLSDANQIYEDVVRQMGSLNTLETINLVETARGELGKKKNELTILGPPEVARAAGKVVGALARLGIPNILSRTDVLKEIRLSIEGYVEAAGEAIAGISPRGSGSPPTITAYTGEPGNG
jgi:hypothetical protein